MTSISIFMVMLPCVCREKNVKMEIRPADLRAQFCAQEKETEVSTEVAYLSVASVVISSNFPPFLSAYGGTCEN